MEIATKNRHKKQPTKKEIMIWAVFVILTLGAILTIFFLRQQFQNFSENNQLFQIIKPTSEKKQRIFLDKPIRNQKIKSPLIINGKTEVSKNNIKIRIKDETNKILTDAFINTKNDQEASFFQTEIYYNMPEEKNGILEIFEYSSIDEEEINKISVPIIFSDFAVATTTIWDIYIDKEYGFEIKYPRLSWGIKKLDSPFIIELISPKMSEYEVGDIKIKTELNRDFQKNGASIISSKKVIIANKNAVEQIEIDEKGYLFKSIYIINEDNLYTILLNLGKQNETLNEEQIKITDQIISTFKFIK